MKRMRAFPAGAHPTAWAYWPLHETLHALHQTLHAFLLGTGDFSSSARTLELYIWQNHARLSVPFYDTETYVFLILLIITYLDEPVQPSYRPRYLLQYSVPFYDTETRVIGPAQFESYPSKPSITPITR